MRQRRNPTLLSIISHARAGALDRAWEMFEQSDLASETGDPRVLTVKGRLLKDRARRATGDIRREGFAQAANAYAAAAALDGSTYPLINAATLALLAGDKTLSRERAQEALQRIDANPDEPETPFYKHATKAEALLLLGREEEALAMLGEGVDLAPLAWEDHASTLRQFELILSQQGAPTQPLDAFRPPVAIHYAGHILIGEGDKAAHLRSEIDSWLAQQNVGFAFGALAAGADIVIAEAVLAAGGELHVVLPCSVDDFVSQSVEPFGADWKTRFEALLDRADTLRCVSASPGQGVLSSLSIALADSTAMGLAMMQARTLSTSAKQLLVLSEAAQTASVKPGAKPGASMRAGDKWAATGLAQHVVQIERSGEAPMSLPAAGERILAACLAVQAVNGGGNDALLRAVALANSGEQLLPPGWHDEQAVFVFAELAQAAEIGFSLAQEGFAVAADLRVCTPDADPLHDGKRLARSDVEALLGSARTLIMPGFHATETFAAAALSELGGQIELQQVCEIEKPGEIGAVPIFLLRHVSEHQFL